MVTSGRAGDRRCRDAQLFERTLGGTAVQLERSTLPIASRPYHRDRCALSPDPRPQVATAAGGRSARSRRPPSIARPRPIHRALRRFAVARVAHGQSRPSASAEWPSRVRSRNTIALAPGLRRSLRTRCAVGCAVDDRARTGVGRSARRHLARAAFGWSCTHVSRVSDARIRTPRSSRNKLRLLSWLIAIEEQHAGLGVVVGASACRSAPHSARPAGWR